jgi:hypothetical protein
MDYLKYAALQLARVTLQTLFVLVMRTGLPSLDYGVPMYLRAAEYGTALLRSAFYAF